MKCKLSCNDIDYVTHSLAGVDTGLTWKENEDNALIVSGKIVYKGKFVNNDDGVSVFTNKSLTNIYENLNKNVPFVMTHCRESYPNTVGWATEFGIDDTGDAIYVKGYVFDEEAIKMVKGGYDQFSIEVLIQKDVDTDEVINGVVGAIAFTQRPAMVDTYSDTVLVSMECESKQQTGDDTTVDKDKEKEEEMKEEEEEEEEEEKKELEDEKKEKLKNECDDEENKYEDDKVTEELKAENELLKTKVAELESKFEAIKQEELTNVKTKLANFGFDDVDSFTSGLDTDKSIDVLNNLYDQVSVKFESGFKVAEGVETKEQQSKYEFAKEQGLPYADILKGDD